MPRVKASLKTRARHKKMLKQAKGYYGARSRTFKSAKEQVTKSLKYAYRDRQARKRVFRQLWITRINAAARLNGLSYNKFISGLKAANIDIDRKTLAEMAVSDPEGFSKLAEAAKSSLVHL